MKHDHLILGVDIDGVLADFNTSFISHIIEHTRKDLFPPRPFDIPVWNYPQHYGYTDAEIDLVWRSIVQSDSFWQKLEPYNHTFEALRYLKLLDAAVYFITSRPGTTAKAQTERWLAELGYSKPTVLISSEKGLCARALQLTTYIDDRIENAVDVATWSRTRSVLFTQPWNTKLSHGQHGVLRTESVVDFHKLLPTPAL